MRPVTLALVALQLAVGLAACTRTPGAGRYDAGVVFDAAHDATTDASWPPTAARVTHGFFVRPTAMGPWACDPEPCPTQITALLMVLRARSADGGVEVQFEGEVVELQ